MLGWLKRLFRPSPGTRPPVTLVSRTCPYCGRFLSRPPNRQGKCPDCGKMIRTWLDPETREKYLLTQSQHRRLWRERTAAGR